MRLDDRSTRSFLIGSALALMVSVALVVWDAQCDPSPFGSSCLGALPALKDYEAGRSSSYQKSGGNFDYVRIPAGGEICMASLEGPGMITHIWVTLGYPARAGYRKLVLRMFFDDAPTPCVLSPLGDFFGQGHAQTYTYESQPLSVGTQGGLNSFWQMPFYRNARITVTNEGRQDCTMFYYYVDYRRYEELPPNMGIFHAHYRQEFPCVQGGPYVLLEAEGTGHYVGTNLSIEQMEDGWWGEGDDRIFIDGSEEPVMHGTGSEDYFCGAWGFSHEFAHREYGQPFRAKLDANGKPQRYFPDIRGQEARKYLWPTGWLTGDLHNVYRYHISDPIPFRQSIRVEIEHGAVNNEQQNNYSSVAYWYQAEPHKTLSTLPTVMERIPHFLRLREHENGVFEGEDFVDVAQYNQGAVHEADMWFWGSGWSCMSTLVWKPVSEGDELVLPFHFQNQGTYRLILAPTHSKEGGRFQVSLNEHIFEEPLDIYWSGDFPGVQQHVCGEVHLATGGYELRFRYLGKDPDSKTGNLDLDYFQFQPY